MNEKIFNVLIQIKNLYPNFHEKNVDSKNCPSLENITKARDAAEPIKTVLAVLQTLGYCKKQPYLYDLAAFYPQEGWQTLLDWCEFEDEIKQHAFWGIVYNDPIAK